MGNQKRPEGLPPTEGVDATHRIAALEIMWRCLRCGELWYRQAPMPEACPSCGAPREEFVLVAED